MKQKFFALTILLIVFLSLAGVVQAEMYGEEALAKQIVVDKEVKFPGKTDFQDHLTASQATFVADNEVEFRLIVKNSGEETLKNIEVFDYLPDDINFTACSDDCEWKGKQLQWKIGELKAGEGKQFNIRAKVAGGEQIKGKGLFCITNWAKARAESGHQDENGSQFCIDARILGAAIPEAGFNFLAAAAAAALLGGAGLFLKKQN
ncbi:hypothetical protein COT66_01050 [Candidatus Shapirobacteria bacterium CG09_land_8_20_14_0_10_49_15]|uniref:DUF11 domain-containing protein n=2 Tax=Candidatus Shapironibacteriota TaxID=1752721 RepID=A0A2M8L6N7_9BACT|nr:MAG: hypothetical protein COT66_01050 [Candidatus Shapirobacteria bacterium CG09_land_8_20_14_0_10_49_15]PJE69905.1 MAG: hypothetical protein COU97_02575 [Candidatus Shapirobacteria bacterium CG10_big_fil_rev_8_21_14_0_10_48_15]